MIDKEDVIDSLCLIGFGSQGWLSNKDCCPFCEKKGKWGVLMDGNITVFHCWKCGTKTSLYNFLKKINRLDLISVNYEASFKTKLVPLIPEEVEEQKEHILSEVDLPFMLQPLLNDVYLNERGFLRNHYLEFEPSFTDYFLENKLHNYIIFKIKQKGVTVAWLARSRYDKEWHEQNLKDFNEGKCLLQLRYRNSECDFTKILGGIDTIRKKVKTLILVEGIFDKINLDKLLMVDWFPEEFGVVFTFGKSISKEQIELIKEINPETVILMYDNDALIEMKDYAFRLQKHFKTRVATIDDPKIDPGNMSEGYLLGILDKIETPINFFTNKLNYKI